MDRWVSNTFRTLGLIVAAIAVIALSLGFALLGLCFAIMSSAGHGGGATPQSNNFLYLGIAAAIAVLVIGIFVIGAVARRILLESKAQDENRPPSPPYPLIPPGTPPIVPQPLAPQPFIPQPAVARPTVAPPSPAPSAPQARAIPNVVTRLSPASAAAIQQLAIAITAKVAAEVALGLVGWNGALGSPRAPFPLYQIGFMAWGLAAIAPHLVLLYALARRPGRTTFAYALVIPSVHILLGLFGHSAFLAFVLRPGQFAAPLLSIIPWFLDILILYLAWKSIRRTGIEPDPQRLIVAAVVIFLYTSLLPVLVFVLNNLHH